MGKIDHKTIILTGGGTAGHVMPNIALLPYLEIEDFIVHYVGQKNSIEQKLISQLDGITFHNVSSGKLRRYFSFKNFSDPFKVLYGTAQSVVIISKVKPRVIFSKGGFVSLPVTLGAKIKGVPVVLHESDLTPGLANKIAMRFCNKVCVSFEETLKYIDGAKGVYTGSPIRDELLSGNMQEAKSFLGLSPQRSELPLIVVMGGSLGSLFINETLRASLKTLLKSYNIVHICGNGHIDKSLEKENGYLQYEYINKELKDIYALADIVVSRAGANSIFELASLCKPNLLIPLPKASSRGDQILNAKNFEKRGFSKVLFQEDMSKDTFISNITDLHNNRQTYIDNMKRANLKSGAENVMNIINANMK